MKKRNKATILGRRYVIDILVELSKSPKRFTDLSKTCPNERTRSILLKEMRQLELINVVSLDFKGRYFVHYKLTDTGKKIIKNVLEIRKLL